MPETEKDVTHYDSEAVEVPFTFTRDGETEHDNFDVIFVDGEFQLFRG